MTETIEPKIITITLERGMIKTVKNVPSGIVVRLIDLDNADAMEDIPEITEYLEGDNNGRRFEPDLGMQQLQSEGFVSEMQNKPATEYEKGD